MKFSPSSTTTAGDDDFSKIQSSPFHIKECLSQYNASTGKQEIVAYEGDSNYSTMRSNSNYNVMIEFPKFYYKRPSKWEFQVSSYPHEGFLPSPMHYRNDVMHDYAYLAKYHSNSNFISQTGQEIATNATWSHDGTGWTLPEFREGFNNQGLYMWDYPLWSSLQILMLVKYATLDVQSLIGFGVSNQSVKQNTGDCDSVKGLDGYCSSNKANNGSIVCLGIENLYGSCSRYIDAVFKNGSTIYINTNINNLNSGRLNPSIDVHPYYDAAPTPIRNINGLGWITDIAYDPQFPWAMYPTATTGDDSDWQHFDMQTNRGLPINDLYLCGTDGDYCMNVGGSWTHGFANGPFNLGLNIFYTTAITGLSAASFFLS